MSALSLVIRFNIPDSEWRLIVIRNQQHVGHFTNGEDVYKIGKVAILPLTSKSPPADLELQVSVRYYLHWT